MIFCNSCGAENAEEAVECETCGEALKKPSAPTSVGDQKVPMQGAPSYQAPLSYNQQVQTRKEEEVMQKNEIPAGYVQKSKLVAAVLSVLFGMIGLGRFYLGYTKIGILQIIASACTGGVGGSLWGILDAILIFVGKISVDGKGKSLKE